jgi:hypothetical protein
VRTVRTNNAGRWSARGISARSRRNGQQEQVAGQRALVEENDNSVRRLRRQVAETPRDQARSGLLGGDIFAENLQVIVGSQTACRILSELSCRMSNATSLRLP